ncbi:MAG TPA: hypothetical protein VF092_17400 [Longimicrobium sp.]
MRATKKETFDLLFDMLKQYYQGLLDGLIKTAGVLIIVAGWVATSSTLAEHLRTHRWERYIGIGLIAMGHILFAIIAYRVYRLSHRTYDLLKEVDYLDSRYYDNFLVRRITYLLYYSANLVITLGIILMLWTIQ